MEIDTGKTIEELITAIAFITDVEDKRKTYHAWRVAILATALANYYIKPYQLKEVFYAGLLHDIGAVGLPHHILYYLAKSERTYRSLLLSHPIIGAQLIWSIPNMSNPARFIFDHHEWFNGEGYPKGKMAREIPFGSQLLRVADFIDINLQQNQYHNLTTICRAIDAAGGEEFSRKLARQAIALLRKNKFYLRIANKKNIPAIFQETKQNLGGLKIKKGIDAIGMTLEVFAQIIDMKHPYTAGHSLRVSRYAMAIGLAMNLEHDEITRLKWSGLIHDVGKLTVSRKILDKPTLLSKKEYKQVASHAYMTEEIMKMISTFSEITPVAASHHEYFNGKGYPNGLKGEEIPFGARILCLCDAFDAMTSNRPYRAPLTPRRACQEIQRLSGIQFDPDIVKEAIPILRSLSV